MCVLIFSVGAIFTLISYLTILIKYILFANCEPKFSKNAFFFLFFEVNMMRYYSARVNDFILAGR